MYICALECICILFLLLISDNLLHLCRDFRLISIGGGADEVMLSIICKYMGTLPKTKKQ